MEHFRKAVLEAFSAADTRGASTCYLKSVCNADHPVQFQRTQHMCLKKGHDNGFISLFYPSGLLGNKFQSP